MRISNSTEVLSNVRKNRMNVWCGYETDIPGPNPSYAANRLTNLFATVKFERKFSISKDDSIYAMGSCFAREIEAALGRENFPILSYRKEILSTELFSGPYEWSPPAFLNRYNTGSMLLEVQRLSDGLIFSEDTLTQRQDGKTIDLHFTGSCYAGDSNIVAERRRITYEMGRSIIDANIIVLTLGLIEAWFDKESGQYINSSPDLNSLRRSGRFELHELDYEDNLENLNKIYELLKSKNPYARFIISVSPVPLQATFTNDDVIIANTRSKSVLRAVAGSFCSDKKDALYFPSYEMVLNSDPTQAFKGDRRHVTSDMVRHIIDAFNETHEIIKNDQDYYIYLADINSDKIHILDQVDFGVEFSGGEILLHPFDGNLGRRAQIVFREISTAGLVSFTSEVQVRNQGAKPVSFNICVQETNTGNLLRKASVAVEPMVSVSLNLDLTEISGEHVDIILSTDMKKIEDKASFAWARFMSAQLHYKNSKASPSKHTDF